MSIQQTMLPNYERDLFTRMGGKDHGFEFAVIQFSYRVLEDPKLERFYGSIDLSSLRVFNRELLDLAFEKHSSDFDVEGRVSLRFLRMFQMGFNEIHFDILVNHFDHALRDAWVEEDVIADAVELLSRMRSCFERRRQMFNTKNRRQSIIAKVSAKAA